MKKAFLTLVGAYCLFITGSPTAHAQDVTAELPYNNALTSSDDISSFTLFHTLGRDWSIMSNALNLWGTAQAYACTPLITFEQGKAYEISFETHVSRTAKDLSIKIGKEATAEGLDIELWSESIDNVSSSTFYTKKFVFAVAETGDYYVAFYGVSDDYNDIYIRNLSIVETIATPKAVTDAAATPAAEGALSVTVSWVNPTETTAGEALDNIEKIEVLNGEDVVATLENLEAGAPASTEIAVSDPGKYTYSIVAYMGENPGDAVSVTSTWVGTAPSVTAVSDVTAEPVADSDTSINLTFTPATATEGYLNPSDLSYKITRSDNGGAEATIADGWNGTLPYVDNTISGLGSYIYHVYTIYQGTTSTSGVASNTVVAGGCASLPYSQSFDTSAATGLYTFFHGPDGSRDWDYSNHALRFWETGTADAYAVTPKFQLEAGKEYELKFDTRISSSSSSSYKNIEVKIGQVPSVDGLTEKLWGETIQSSSYTTYSQVFSVETSGEYYVGFRCHGTSNYNDIYLTNIILEEVVAVPNPVAELSATPADKGELKVNLSWTNPSETTTGETIDRITKVEVKRGTELIATLEDIEGGSASTYEDTVDKAGTYTYTVTPYLAWKAGESSTVTSAWVGKATSIPTVTDVVAEPVADSDTSVSLTFTQPEPTQGYLDPTEVAYKITRSDNGATAVTIEDAWQGELPYIDNTITELSSYVYHVYVVFNGSTSWSSGTSNTVVTGGCAALPYSQNFNSNGAGDLYTFFHGPDGDHDWTYSTYNKALTYYSSTTADAYAVTPKFKLQQGRAYELSFSTKVSRNTSPKNLAVKIGLVPDVAGLNVTLWDETIESQYSQTKTQIFSVPADGEYYIGFHCYGESDMQDLYVDDITLQEVDAVASPVTNLTATPAEQGALKVTVAWTNPSESTAGITLDNIEKVEVRRGSTVIATLENLAAGSESSVEDTVDEPGVYTYSVVPYLDENAGQAESVTTTWVGMDTPKAPENVVATADGNNVNVVFDAVTEGVNGGYINPSNLNYIIKRNDDVITDNCTSSPHTDNVVDLPLALYTYSVAATNGDHTSEFTSATPLKLGEAIELPYEPDFADEATRDLLTSSLNSAGNPAWSYSSARGGMSTSSSNSVLITPPLDVQKGEIEVKWKATCYNALHTEDFEILLCSNDDFDNLNVIKVIAEPHVESVNWPEEMTATTTVPVSGRYYVALRANTVDWTLYVEELKVLQSNVTTGIREISFGTGSLNYNASTHTISVESAGKVMVSNVAGTTLFEDVTDGDDVEATRLSAGLYIISWIGENGKKEAIKVAIK